MVRVIIIWFEGLAKVSSICTECSRFIKGTGNDIAGKEAKKHISFKGS